MAMLDIKFIRENTEAVKANLVNRHNDFDLDEVIELDRKRRELLQMTEALKSERNAETKKIALAKKNKEDASAAISAMREVGTKIAAIDKELAGVELILQDRLLRIPNMTDASVPVGKDDSENPEVRRWGEIRKFPFPAKEHYELGETWAFLILNGRGRCQVRVSISISVWQPVWKELCTISCLMFIHSRTISRKLFHHISLMVLLCREPDSSLNLRMICTKWKGKICT